MQSEADFVDGIMFSENFGVVMTGSFSDKVKLPNATFHKFSDEWFYLHVKKVVSKRDGFEELIPTRDYLFRYDRGAFWTARFAFHIHHFPFIRVFRVLFAWLFKTRTVLSFLHGSNMSQNYLVQDLCMPKDTVVNFMQFINKTYGVFPLWLCPLKANLKEPLSPTYNKSDLVVNVGVYGELKTNFQDFIDQNRLVQATVKSLGGRKVLYAHSYYKKAEFWDIYDKKGYEKLRQKYAAEQTFPDIFQKISVSKELIPSLLGGWKQLLRNWFTYKVR
jgi:hypothetical protein